MTQHSLRRRSFLIGLVTIAFALLLAGAGIVLLFERHVERALDDDLDAFVDQIRGRLGSDSSAGKPGLSDKAALSSQRAQDGGWRGERSLVDERSDMAAVGHRGCLMRILFVEDDERIARVRKKIGSDVIETRRGLGYIVPNTTQ
ncbi:hypothetical protein [Methylocystis bryophila]|uniref:Uncharacterized protein n=1 Tax=Methylocystis bryophila TaxID=655015 RepID=A0A1W6MZJ0_9HYPH|nr:hypothetical protein [Methylocystis bryophila]ARN82959.1 hypothetical protein B1812_19855 [Methylocystis bryophila]BDV39247.1 hypothetical protein DSM21852_25000 [Methylocystis bryophila]